MFVEPPAGAVDVNVHPQKAEVRFSEPQQIYAAVRRVLAAAVAAAPWTGELASLSGQVATNMSDAPAADEAPRAAPAGVPPGRVGAIPIGFAPVRVGEAPRSGRDDEDSADARQAPASARRRAAREDEDADETEPGDTEIQRSRARRSAALRRPDSESEDDGPPRRAASADDLSSEDDEEDDAPGPAVRRAQQAAAAAAAGRRSEAEAWLSRAEASIDASRRPLVETDLPLRQRRAPDPGRSRALPVWGPARGASGRRRLGPRSRLCTGCLRGHVLENRRSGHPGRCLFGHALPCARERPPRLERQFARSRRALRVQLGRAGAPLGCPLRWTWPFGHLPALLGCPCWKYWQRGT
ncbi:hypothetical protein [Nannocystis pusilla]|uniref:hypothetical protein n=1 Tax=Nannocystis pusilla TaxID=889268 RepID=UPI003B7D1C5E